ncbi:MAG: histidine phosphatase family protein [SAR202 cluster bacterium]|nr:histidine phosphatase family protein [SAR202 cluster bacterium]
MPRWYLVRHGQTDWNTQDRVQGHTDVPLNAAGRAQAERVGDRLAGVPLNIVYTGDLARAAESARIIVAKHPAGLDARRDTRLRELSYGRYEGLRFADIRGDDAISARDAHEDMDAAPPGGESLRQLLDRAGAFAERMRLEHREHHVLIVSHGGTIRALAVKLLGLPDSAFHRLRGLQNASISIVDASYARPAITAWNDTSHLVLGE